MDAPTSIPIPIQHRPRQELLERIGVLATQVICARSVLQDILDENCLPEQLRNRTESLLALLKDDY